MSKYNKEYQKKYHKIWYTKNADERRKQIHKRRNEIRRWLTEYKMSCRCCLCGEKHPATLDFHHINQSDKILEISTAINNGWSIGKIQVEIEKCNVLCSNCHRKEHWKTPS